MEQLIQKYMKYFYIALIIIISLRLISTVFTVLTVGFQSVEIISIVLLIINILLLVDSTKHNIKQQFTECKSDAKILRFTLGLLVTFHMLTYFESHFDWAILTDHLMILSIIEILLTHRIKSIEHLEKMASKVSRRNTLDQEGG